MARHASDLELLRFEDSFDGEIRLDEPLSKHTSYRIGGPARLYPREFASGSFGGARCLQSRRMPLGRCGQGE